MVVTWSLTPSAVILFSFTIFCFYCRIIKAESDNHWRLLPASPGGKFMELRRTLGIAFMTSYGSAATDGVEVDVNRVCQSPAQPCSVNDYDL